MSEPSTATLLEAALVYAARGWRLFPCHTPLATGCSCGRDCGKRQGKHPRTEHGLSDASADPATIRRWWRRWPTANIGLVTGAVSGFVALDIDSYAGGEDSLDELMRSYRALPETVEQLTGGGGRQVLFLHPGVPIKNGVSEIGQGLDVRGDGGYIVAPPSLHLSGRRYAWELSHDPEETPLAAYPDWLKALTLVTARRPAVEADAAIGDGQRNDHLFRLGASMRARGFTEVAILAALEAINATQCYPPLDDDEVAQIAASCGRYPVGTSRNGMHPPPDMMPQADATPPSDEPPSFMPPTSLETATAPWREFLITNKKGEPTENASNMGLVLANHPRWQGKLWWDSVRSTPMIDGGAMTAEHITQVAQWMGVTEHMPIRSLTLLERCLLAECKKHARDLLQTWLNGLPPWDQVPRLDDWLVDVTGIAKTIYAMAVSRILPLSMVARAMDPGCLYRYVVILEGAEEIGKSSLVRALAGDGWYVELAIGLESKESHMMLQGAWVAELAELDSLSRTEETRLKAFITLKEDSYIPKYSNYRVTTPRRTIFIGTTNEASYLKGQTGNTRFLPIKVSQVDMASFRDIREQLFAEALYAYHGNPPQWWRLSEEALREAEDEREQRRIVNIYEQDLEDWLETRRFQGRYMENGEVVYTPIAGETTWEEIARCYLRVDSPERWKDIAMQKQISAALKALGWSADIIWRDGKTRRIWAKAPKV